MTVFIDINHLRGALLVAPKKDPRAQLNAIRIEATPDRVITVATDGHALVAAWSGNPHGDTGAWTIPRETVEAAHLAIDGDKTALDVDTGSFPFDDSKLPQYPDWRMVWPAVTFDPAEAPCPEINPDLLATVQRALAGMDGRKGAWAKKYPLAVRPGRGDNSAVLAQGKARNLAAVVMSVRRQDSEHINPPQEISR